MTKIKATLNYGYINNTNSTKVLAHNGLSPYIFQKTYSKLYMDGCLLFIKSIPCSLWFCMQYHVILDFVISRPVRNFIFHYDDVIMTAMASQITSLMIVYSTVYSGAYQRKHRSSASLAFAWGIHRDRWIPGTKGQLRGKCFHLMTSSCYQWSCFVLNLVEFWRDLNLMFPLKEPSEHFHVKHSLVMNFDQS